jgi:CheY-like chemotaxis protein
VVLVVEDEWLLRCALVSDLRDAGYIVVESSSGEAAVALSKSDTSIDIVVTDINLSGATTGWDVAERCRTDRPDVAVLYTSGNYIEPGRCVPDSVIVPKPCLPDDIICACQRLRPK